ncbi:hypothetical protein LPJ63_003815 [Coemansia sp. RSA 2711]|nr:hypothetical protein LPJ63_003815 [Coemansia sp. RSA 2711]
MAYVRRKRRQQRQLLEGDTGYNELSFNNVRTAVPHQRQVKKRIVLSESQFDMLPRIIAQDSTKQSSNDADEKSKADGSFGVSSEVESCSICLCDITGGEELVSLIPCHHEFHVSCASQWLTQKSTMCPLCKADMLEGLGFKRPKSFGEDNDDIELVTIPASPNNAADTVSAAEPQTTAPPGPTPPAPAVTTTRQSRLID